ncbi:glycosyltransferase family A protein [Poseidonocella sedimentorum]|uniref:Glycosyl transferase family 2 n=1 Tax=Poseidonocella sedimentorum TaxID=871652 RepID=A0A1I6ED47_9RHOB|nr:glycosyltransferase family A protein [Poseidonocella sedimentorum]SFR15674.1 hypothetical protein SAMN04515673_11031 [Poseidonocella sedimentorum]
MNSATYRTEPKDPAGPDLTVAVSTLAADAGQLRLPLPHPRLRYLVLVQGGAFGADNFGAGRSDLEVVALDSFGLSRSRNAAMLRAQTPFLVFSDADIVLDVAGLLALADALRAAPELDFVAGWREDRLAAARPSRRRPHALSRRTAGRVCAPELMLRLEAVRRQGLGFDPEFGLGARHPLGEEYVFIADALAAGLRGRSLPVVAGRHPGESTGHRAPSPALWGARQAVLRRVFGPLAPLIRPLYAWRMRRQMRPGVGALLLDMGRFALGGRPGLRKED